MCWNFVPMVPVLNPSTAKFFICCCCKHVKDTVVVIVTNIFIKLINADLYISKLAFNIVLSILLPAFIHPNTNTGEVFKQ